MTGDHSRSAAPSPGRAQAHWFAAAVFALLALLPSAASAKPVEKDEAAAAVSGWLKHPGRGLNAPIGNAVKETEAFTDAAGNATYFVVYLKPSGFVIVPADDLVEPIICFSPAGKYVASGDNPLGAMVMRDIPGRLALARAKQPLAAPQAALKGAQRKWDTFRDAAAAAATPLMGTGFTNVSDPRVDPLTQTRWNQGDVSSGYCYNYYTPNHDVCGCVATAMAQLMRFWQYPAAGVGQGTFTIYVDGVARTATLRGGNGIGGPYDWADMALDPNSGGGATDTQRQAIGALCSDAGVAVGMGYTSTGSSGSVGSGDLKNVFFFSNAVSGDGGGLNDRLNPNLDAGYPCLMSIAGPAVGHEIIADGYGYDSSTLYYHLNMGWGGYENAWYNLPVIAAGSYNFNAVTGCMYNVYAAGTGEIISGRVLDAGNHPVSGATVQAVRAGGGAWTASTNAHGVYAFAKVPSGSTYVLSVTAPSQTYADLTAVTGISADYGSSGNSWGKDFTAATTLIVQSAPPTGLSIGSSTGHDGTTNYTKTGVTLGAGVNLQAPATDPAGYAFSRWTVNGAAQTAGQKSITFSMSAGATAVAQYNTYTLSVQSTPPTGLSIGSTTGNSGTTNYTDIVVQGASVNLQAPAADPAGFTFAQWTVGGAAQASGLKSVTFTMTADTTAVAQYNAVIPTYTLTVQSTPPTGLSIGSSTSHGGTTNYTKTGVAQGTSVNLQAPATDPAGCTFLQWTVNGAAQTAGQKSVTFTMSAATTAVAQYTTNSSTMSIQSAPPTGLIIGSSTGHGGTTNYVTPGVALGTSVNLQAPATDPAGYSFSQWTVNGVAQNAGMKAVTFPAANCFACWGNGGNGTDSGRFFGPNGIALDRAGNVYVADSHNNRIQKFTPDGQYVSQFGSTGTGNGQFFFPCGIALDRADNVYVTDLENDRVEKFTSAGVYVTQWGGLGSGNGKLSHPYAIAIDGADNVYVADSNNFRIQKFTSDGAYVTQWGGSGSGNGQFYLPYGIAAGSAGYVYVADTDNGRIQKFTYDGQYVSQWGSYGSGNGKFGAAMGISLDSVGNVYVADSGNNRIQKFTADGEYVTQWGSTGTGNGQFIDAQDIALDSAGNVYVTDFSNNRVQKFTPGGAYVTQWGSWGNGNGQFNAPNGVAFDRAGNLYVADTNNNRIQKFTSGGAYVTQWGSYGSGNGQLNSPYGIALDSAGNVYVADGYNYRIQKFTSDGVYVTQWGSPGSGDGQFARECDGDPFAVALDGADNVYVTDVGNNRIQKFTSDGQYVSQWGSLGSSNGQFNGPYGLALDSAGYVYVSDVRNNRIQKFTSDGHYVTQWGAQNHTKFSGLAVDSVGNVYVADSYSRIQKFTSDGQFVSQWGSGGSGIGQFYVLGGIALNSEGNVYVADWGNNRIQAFNQSILAVAQYSTVGANYTLSVQSTPPTGLGIGSSTGHGGTTNYTKTGVASGASVNLQAPATDPGGYTFLQWTVNGAAQTAGQKSVAFTMSADTTAVAQYNAPVTSYTLTAQSTPPTGLTIGSSTGHNGTTNYSVTGVASGTSVNLQAPATDPSGYTFSKWTLGGAAQTTGQKSITFTMTAAATAVAQYSGCTLAVQSTPPTGLTIGSSTGHGGTTNYTVTDVAQGASVNLQAPATDPSGYAFSQWTVNGAAQTTGQKSITFTVTAATTAVAQYSGCTLAVQSAPPMGLSIGSSTGHNGTTNYTVTGVASGMSVNLQAPATDPSGYAFSQWTLGGAGQTAGQKSVTFTMTADTTAEAQYNAQVPGCTLTVQSTPPTGLTVSSSTGHGGTTNYAVTGVAQGANVNLQAPATDPSGYVFSQWMLGVGAQASGQKSITFSVTADTTAVAVYALPGTGGLSITLGPAAAVAAGAHWQVDEGNWQASGATVSGLVPGVHTINYEPVQGWTAPVVEQAAIAAGVTMSLTRTYVVPPAQTGGVQVTLTPAAAVTAGAKWNVDGGAWQSSGVTVSGLSVGAHVVNYNAVAGWNSPASASATVTYNTTTTVTGAYIQQTGGVQVTLRPAEAVTAGAKWNVDGGAWQNSGATVGLLAVGAHTINYNKITLWDSPASELVTVAYNTTTTVIGSYLERAGSLQVTLAPDAAITAGAKWNVDGGAWQSSGATVSTLPVGSHTVNYQALADWSAPPSESATITYNGITALSRTYAPHTGNLTVTLLPAAAVTAGAKWSVDGGATWQNSGAALTGLPVGGYTVSYQGLNDWDAPPSDSVTVTYNGTTSLSRTYAPHTGSLMVTLLPVGAVAAGARWNVDGGAWQRSGTTLSGILVGARTVNFNTIADWTSPTSQVVTISTDLTMTATRIYEHIGPTGQSFSLAAGYNLISLPFCDSGCTTAENWCWTIAGCQAIWKWDGALQQWSGHIPGTPTNNFALAPGAAYLVAVGGAGTVLVPGTDWAAPSFSLKVGYNLISLPKSKESLANAESLAGNITACTAIWKWDKATQTWSGHIPGTPTNNFSVAVGEAYLVNVTAASNWP